MYVCTGGGGVFWTDRLIIYAFFFLPRTLVDLCWIRQTRVDKKTRELRFEDISSETNSQEKYVDRWCCHACDKYARGGGRVEGNNMRVNAKNAYCLFNPRDRTVPKLHRKKKHKKRGAQAAFHKLVAPTLSARHTCLSHKAWSSGHPCTKTMTGPSSLPSM